MNRTYWTLQSKDDLDGVAASADGRYALLAGDYNPAIIENLVWRLPWKKIREKLEEKPALLHLFERPGKLRARLRYNPTFIVPFMGEDDPRRVGETCNNWILSPDGKSVILKYQYMGIGGKAMLYRW